MMNSKDSMLNNFERKEEVDSQSEWLKFYMSEEITN